MQTKPMQKRVYLYAPLERRLRLRGLHSGSRLRTLHFALRTKNAQFHAQFVPDVPRTETETQIAHSAEVSRNKNRARWNKQCCTVCRFATRSRNGLLLYNGRYNEQHDFISLELVEGNVQFTFSLGNGITTATASVPGGVSDGEWHKVTVSYFNKVRNKRVFNNTYIFYFS